MKLGLTGPSAAGKGEIAKILIAGGFCYISLSEIVREEARKRNIEMSRENLQNLGNSLRKEFGAGFSVPFARLPKISLEYARLLRNLKVQEAIYELLTQQYEQAKIMEAKDTPTVQILDKASPPERKSFPKRGIIIILVFITSFALNFLGICVVLYFNEEKRKEQSNIKRLIVLWEYLKGDFTKILRKFKK